MSLHVERLHESGPPTLLELRPTKFLMRNIGFTGVGGLPSACWEFQGHLGVKGHGQMRWEGRLDYVHRISWRLTHGPIPDGMWVLHRCNNARCGNPEHLYLGSHLDNMADMRIAGSRKGKTSGEKSGRAILNEGAVLEARRRYLAGESQPEIARSMGVSTSCIAHAITRRNWKEIQ